MCAIHGGIYGGGIPSMPSKHIFGMPTQTHPPPMEAWILPKIFVGGCHLLQEIGDVIGYVSHLGQLALEGDFCSLHSLLLKKH